MNTRVVDRAESEWVVIENHHEAIIAPEVFDKVQQLWGRKSRDISRKGIKPVKGLNVLGVHIVREHYRLIISRLVVA